MNNALTQKNVITIINNIFYEHFDTKVTANTTLYELNADSLDVVEITMALEDQFNINIDDVKIECMIYVKDVYEYICKCLEIEFDKTQIIDSIDSESTFISELKAILKHKQCINISYTKFENISSFNEFFNVLKNC